MLSFVYAKNSVLVIDCARTMKYDFTFNFTIDAFLSINSNNCCLIASDFSISKLVMCCPFIHFCV